MSQDRSRVDFLQFDKALKNIIDSFERAREWADLSNCLQKVKKQIDLYKGIPIPRQRDLAKRLAQCLNPEINVIHQLTMEVYKEVFEREKQMMELELNQKNVQWQDRKSSIALFFSGLFNFYQFAAFEVKQSFLELVDKYLIKMKKELIISLPGFMLCMLPALEDQNSDIQKKIDKILSETEQIVGTSEFYGEIWKAMLRTPRARLSAIRFLDKKIPKDIRHAQQYRDHTKIHISNYTIKIINREVQLQKDPQREAAENERRRRMDLHDYFYFYYPNKSKLVINALLAGLSIAEQQTYVNRGTLDFMISHMAINSNINSIEERISLVECATLAYTRRDFATQNKISNWLFGHIDEEEEEVNHNDPAIITIVESQKKLFQKSMEMKTQPQQVKMIGGMPNTKIGLQETIDPIQILLRIFSDEQNTTVPILKHLSIHLVRFIKFHLKNRNIDLQRFRQILVNLLEQISHQYKSVLECIGTKLELEIENLNFENGQQNMQLETLDLISFAIFDLITLQRKLFQTHDSKQYLTIILSCLLRGMSKISNNHQNLELVLPCLELIDQILNILEYIDKGAILYKQTASPNFRQGIDSFNLLYVNISKKLIESDSQQDMQQQKYQLETFKKYNDIMLKILQLQNVDSGLAEMPQWLDMLIQSSKTRNIKICLVSTEVLLQMLISQKYQYNEIVKDGGPIMHIQRLIADSKGTSRLSQAGLQKQPQQFYKNFLSVLQAQDSQETKVLKPVEQIQSKTSTPKIPEIQQDGDDQEIGKNGYTQCKEIIKNLWSMVDQESDIEKIVILLREFDRIVPILFSEVVIEDLEDENTQEQAIKKFTVFWKHTAQFYPYYKPFEVEMNQNTGKKLNSEVGDRQMKKYLALHNMLDFLENTDPTLRLSCRSWLSQSNRQFNRILDPIFEEFIANSNFTITNNKVIIQGKFERKYVIENFGKFRNIILNTQDDIIEYMIKKSCMNYIVQLFKQKYHQHNQNNQPPNQMQGSGHLGAGAQKIISSSSERDPGMPGVAPGSGSMAAYQPYEALWYLDVLVEITLQFIRAEYEKVPMNQSNKLQFDNQQAENLTVNASACEFMLLILKQVEKYHSVSNKIAHIIIKPLIDTFYHVTKSKNYAMQVNIINLLELILLECNFQGTRLENQTAHEIQEMKAKCIKIFSDDTLISSIILGLKCDVSYVRQKFIRFVEILVPYLRKFTKENNSFIELFRKSIEMLTDCFCELLKRVDVSQFSNSRMLGNNPTSIRLDKQKGNTLINPYDIQRNRSGSSLTKSTPMLSKAESGRGSGVSGFNDSSLEDDEEYIQQINQDADIIQIIGGLQCIINTCLDIKVNENVQVEDEKDDDELNAEEMLKAGKSKNEASKKTGLFGFFGGGEHFFNADIFQDTKKMMYDKIQHVLISCIYCWNHLELFSWNDYHFSRFGSFGYPNEDNRRILEKMQVDRKKGQLGNNQLSDLLKSKIAANEKYLTFGELLEESSNSIHKKVLQLLRPIAKKIPDQFIEGALNIWLRKSMLGDKVDVNRCYEKIIQMIVCVYQVEENKSKGGTHEFVLPVYQVIQSMIKYIQATLGKEPLVNIRRWTKNNPPLSVTQTSSETLLNSFMYTYLLYNPQMFDQFFQTRSEEKVKEYQKVYTNMLKYFTVFKYSRNPFTIQWLLEILNILSIKFALQESKLDGKQKKEYHDLFNNMLTNCASIMTETFNISFHDDQQFKIAFPPTVYEFLWRYEYMAYKNTVLSTSSANFKMNVENSPDSRPNKLPLGVDRRASAKQGHHSQQQAELGNQMQAELAATNGSVFFNNATLKHLADQKFEFQHSGGRQNNDESIFQNMELLMKDKYALSKDYQMQSNFMEDIKLAIRGKTFPNDLLVQTKYFTILTLKQLMCQLLVNLVGTGDAEKMNKSMQLILLPTIQILQNYKKSNNTSKKDVMNEFITDFFSFIVERAHSIDPNLIKPYRREIIDLFNADNFFQASMINLKHWQKIIKYFVDGKPEEMFEQHLQQWNYQGGVFANQLTISVQRCYAMKRIAFLIFSCEDDEFQGQLDQLMKKMIEVFKQKQRIDLRQRLFLFFLTRVMLIRLNFATLTEALRKLWPHLLNELISVFEVKDDEQTNKAKTEEDTTELTIEAIKLVELLSSLNIEDFQMNQWIFLIDGYGMKEENQFAQNRIDEMNQQSEESKTSENTGAKKMQKTAPVQTVARTAVPIETNEVFKTFIVRFIGNQEYSFYNVEAPQDGRIEIQNYNYTDDFKDQTVEDNWSHQSASPSSNKNKNTRQAQEISGSERSDTRASEQNRIASTTGAGNDFVHINVRNKEFDERLQEQASSLQQSINDSNVIGNEFNRQEAESKIESDFLQNDSILN